MNSRLVLWALPVLALPFGGCATVFEGTSQEVSVVTNPPGAHCSFVRNGMEVGTIADTPGTANIRKSKYDVTIRCDKDGYQEADYLNHSGTTAAIAGNVAADVLLTAGLSSIVDSADGADNQYDSAVNITLLPLESPAQARLPSTVATPTASAATAAAATSQRLCTEHEETQKRIAIKNGYSMIPNCQ